MGWSPCWSIALYTGLWVGRFVGRSPWVGRCKPGHYKSVSDRRSLWASRCRSVAMSRCGLIVTGRSLWGRLLWVGCCGFVVGCGSLPCVGLLLVGRYESLRFGRWGLFAMGWSSAGYRCGLV